MREQTADLTWRDDRIPVSNQFDDPYYSLENGLAETRHVFLAGNNIPARFSDGFHIAELGFGSGLNFLTTWLAWKQSGVVGRLKFTSFEAFPMAADDMSKALAAFPEIKELAERLSMNWTTAGGVIEIDPDIRLEVVIGDARKTVPAWQGVADAWFLDGFAPAKNPELWSSSLLQSVAAHTHIGGSFATYTAAGQIRRDLDAAGFDVERVAGFGRKRHMSIGTLRGNTGDPEQ